MAVRDFDIERLKGLEQGEWGRLQTEYHDRVYGYIKRQVGNPDLAEDLTQEAFLGAVRGIGNFNPKYNVEQFLMGIAKNKVIDHLRRQRPEVNIPNRNEDSSGLFATTPDATRRPSQILQAQERMLRQRGALVSCLKEMVRDLWDKGDYRKLMAIELCFLKDWKHRAIAERLGIDDEKSIAGIKFRAIRDLQTRLRRRDPRKTLFSALWDTL